MTSYLDLAPCGIFSMNHNGQLLAVNDYLCQLLQLPREVLLQKNISSVVSFGTRIFFQTHFFPMMRIKDAANEVFIYLMDTQGKQIPVLLNARKTDGQPTEIVCAALVIENRNQYEDEIIAARKYAEEALQENTELQQARKQLQQHAEELDAQIFMLEQRNKDLEQVNRVLTHNLQEPLRKMMVLSSMLLEPDRHPEPQVATTLERIQKVALHTRNLVDQVQRFVQSDMLDAEQQPVDINELLTCIANKMGKDLPQGTINLHLSPALPIPGFANDLSYLFEELLHNAVKFAEPQRPLIITISSEVMKSNKFRRLANRYRYTDFLCVRITDNGKGFDPHYGEVIFQLFQKLDPLSAGLGLGLAMCKKIIERHQGFITAHSTRGLGTEISCYLPLER